MKLPRIIQRRFWCCACCATVAVHALLAQQTGRGFASSARRLNLGRTQVPAQVVCRASSVDTTDLTALNASLPFIVDAELVSEDARFENALETVSGKADYLAAMKEWQQKVPQRLQNFCISDVQTYAFNPYEITCLWTCEFKAPLPPTVRLRGLVGGLRVLPGERIEVEAKVKEVLRLDDRGRVVNHKGSIVSGYGVIDAIARYELLTAMRRESENPVSWYWKVLRQTTLEELGVLQEGKATSDQLQWQFTEMIVRNFSLGIGIGVLFYTFLKFLLNH
eukprot:TRINITY_DN26362_c0_g1_i1.p1 TRINITY_DN26362_c0_g1~~TRINITY_DN26362_c0_g1_i1.p1  ORF type:complete len:278 (+),score=47.58 TRINITY_DN26362_c0_g1_i1:53-886(+)